MKLTLTQPDDWHLHLRDGAALRSVVGHTAAQFKRAIIMPNLTPPVNRCSLAREYRKRILDALPAESGFEPLMTLYLTQDMPPDEIHQAAESDFIYACKLYPAGATTNSDAGVSDIQGIYPILESMQKHNLVLCLHGEVVDSDVDIFDREAVFLDRTLSKLCHDFPELRIVLEHITTADAASFVEQAPANIAATITPQHLLFSRNDLLVGGIKPHYYCLPILKRDRHREALNSLITRGNPKFFLGTDSAPHARTAKETACGCAGMYSAHAAMSLYATAFEANDALHQLEGFASFHGADFYGLPRNQSTLTLEKKPWIVPQAYAFAEHTVIPMKAGETMQWQLADNGI